MATIKIKMANQNSFAAKAALCLSILILQGCSGSGVEEASPLGESTSTTAENSERPVFGTNQPSDTAIISVAATDTPIVQLGAAIPTNPPTSIPIASTNTSNSLNTGTNYLSVSALQPDNTYDAQYNSVLPLTDIAPGESGETNGTNDGSLPTTIESDTTESVADSVYYIPIPITPIEGEFVLSNATVEFAWSIPAVLISTLTGFDLTIYDSSNQDVSYQNNLVPVSVCSDEGNCKFDVEITELPVAIGENIWAIRSIGNVVDSVVAEASFNVETATDSITSNEIEVDEPIGYSHDYLSIKALVDDALSRQLSWDTYPPASERSMNSIDGYYSGSSLTGMAAAYAASQDISYLDMGITLSNRWIDSGRDRNGDGFLDWADYANPATSYNIEHHEWRAAMGVAHVLLAMRDGDYDTANQSKFCSFLKREVWQKWTHGHNHFGAGYKRSSLATQANDLVGRLGVTAVALHQCDGGELYAEYINSDSSPFGKYFATQLSIGSSKIPGQTDDNRGDAADTSHAGDLMNGIITAKRYGYDPGGQMDAVLENYEARLNNLMFKTSAGFTSWTDGTGRINKDGNSAAHGHAWSAALSPTLLDRWVDYYLNQNPFFNHDDEHVVYMGAQLMWALRGNTL